jgi:CIC family chloride channel protein
LALSSTGLVVLAVAVGIGAGIGAVAFRELILASTRLFSGSQDYAATPGAAHAWFPGLGRYFLLIVPVLAGLLYGPLVTRFAPEARGHGVPEVMLAVAERGGRINGRVAIVKSLASALTLGSGGSVGREGPIVQIGSALGSVAGRVVRAPESRLRLLVACGAAAGISATFNAPIAGVVFALELIVQDFAAEAFGVVVLSSVASAVVGRAAFGNTPFLRLPAFTVTHSSEYALFALLGLLAGVAGFGFARVIYLVEDICDHVWKRTRLPEALRPAFGGVVLGGVLLALPEMYGVGYPVLEHAVHGGYLIGFLLVLLLGKVLATSLTLGIGGSGGVFAPSLFCGAMLGEAFGLAAHDALPHIVGPAGAYALIGMAAVFAGSARAPITAVIILFELTGEYSIILPLMLAVVLATGASKVLGAVTIYTLKLQRRGVELHPLQSTHGQLRARRVETVMRPAPPRVPTTLDGAGLVAALGARGVVLVDGPGPPHVVTAHALADALSSDDTVTALALAQAVPVIAVSDSVRQALSVLLHDDGTGAAVTDQEGRVVGWIDHRAILADLAGSRSPEAPLPEVVAVTPGLSPAR